MTAYLLRHGNVVYTFAEYVASNGGKVQDRIKDLQEKAPEQPMREEIENFTSYIRDLQVALQRGGAYQ